MERREKDKLIKRANRALAKVQQKLVVNRGRTRIEENGEIHRVDVRTGEIMERRVNLDTIFHEDTNAMAAAA